MKPTEKPDTQRSGNIRQSNKMTPRELILCFCALVMLMIATVSITINGNNAAHKRADVFVQDNVLGRLKNHESDIITLKESWATVPVLFEQLSRDITEIKLDIKELSK